MRCWFRSLFLETSTKYSVAKLVLLLAMGTFIFKLPASAEDIGPFYIKHFSSGKYVHPEGGRGKTDVTAVVHSGKAAHTQFIFRRVEGEWGHIIHMKSGLILIPYGGKPNSDDNTRIVFHRDPTPGSYFSIDQDKQGIKHYSGRYWHPHGGDTRPNNNTGVVVHRNHGMATRFYAVDIKTDQALPSFMPSKRPVRAGKTTGYWAKACAGGHSCTRKLSNSLQIMNSKEKTLSREERNSIEVSISAGVEFPGGSASTEVTSTQEVATSEAKTIARSQDVGVGEECEQPVDFEKFQIFALWQWVLSTSMGQREIQMKTCHITCTPDGNRPTYVPGSQKDIQSCWIPRR